MANFSALSGTASVYFQDSTYRITDLPTSGEAQELTFDISYNITNKTVLPGTAIAAFYSAPLSQRVFFQINGDDIVEALQVPSLSYWSYDNIPIAS